MPIAGTKPHTRTLPQYFKSFDELDEWRAGPSTRHYLGEGILSYTPVRTSGSSEGKLLVCVARFQGEASDIFGLKLSQTTGVKGGYVEDPFSKSYSFNWWSRTSVFNYFAHHRVSIPPPEWITASHRQGVPILGTVIFEGTDSGEDCLRMVVGKHATSLDGRRIPVSPYYANLLADLAVERGFDGWIVNIEIELDGGSSQARGLASWLGLFQQAILRKVGPHGLVLWYDSVTTQGKLSWQERLCSRNLPFFLNSGGLYTNYNWYNHFPERQITYFNKLNPTLTSKPHNIPKSIQDIYAGIDMWGRGSHGGGGFGIYKALEHVKPKELRLSVSLFAPGWTWESEDQSEGSSYAKWLQTDQKLWAGPREGDVVEVPPTAYKPVEPMCSHGPFKPISNFFDIRPPPDPLDLAFYTSFSPGAGDGWWVEGRQVFRSPKGWTDIHKQTSIGDLVWPKPKIYNIAGGTGGERNVSGTTVLTFKDVWNGGSSLQINLAFPSGASGVHWIPIQSLSLSCSTRYEAAVTYKFELGGAGPPVRTKFDVAVRPLEYAGEEGSTFKLISSTTTNTTTVGWRKTQIIFELDAPSYDRSVSLHSSIGLLIGVSTTTNTDFELPTIFVGQIAVYPHLPLHYKDFNTSLSRLSFEPAPGTMDGTLSWEVVASLPHVPELEIADREDPHLPWNMQPTQASWFPAFLYFNVYVLLVVSTLLQGGSSLGGIGGGNSTYVKWLGTTGYDGTSTTFPISGQTLPQLSPGSNRHYAFQVEGVLETGEVIRWSPTSHDDGAPKGESHVAMPPIPLDGDEEDEAELARQLKTVWLKSLISPFRRKRKGRPLSAL